MNTPFLHQSIELIKALRHPVTGCPWDLQQSHRSLLPYFIEEVYEFLHAVESGDAASMSEELGDVFLQILLHCQLAQEKGLFDLEKVCSQLNAKILRRHPHVFGKQADKLTAEQVQTNWQEIKRQEKPQERMGRIPRKLLNLPALSSAHKIGLKTQQLQFDWAEPSQVVQKVQEEWLEFSTEYARPDSSPEKVREELGDLLFSLAQLCRHLDIPAEEVLHAANQKFVRRFEAMEDLCDQTQSAFEKLSSSQKEALWKQVKQQEK